MLAAGRPEAVERAMAELLRTEPANMEARYALAIAQRHLRKWPLALDTLGRILAQRSNFGRAYQEAGYNHIALRRFREAQTAFERATAADSSLINSWKCLAKLYGDSCDATRAAAASEQVAFLDSLPSELLAVMSYLSEHRLADAERLCKRFLQDNKTHVEGMRLLAEIAVRNQAFDRAEFLLESCVAFEPMHRAARMQYVNVLLRMQKFVKAHEQARRLWRDHPDDTDAVRALYAAACAGVGDNAEAARSYRLLMERHPNNPFYPISLGHIRKAAGDIDDAVALYRRAHRVKNDHGDAFWSLANTKSYVFTDDEVAHMQTVEADANTGDADRIQVRFALGNAYEQRRQYETAFRCYSRGNELKRPQVFHDPQQLQVRIDSQIQVCDAALFASRAGVGFDAPDPIFVVGLPRAGSTLLEQILSSHSLVDGTMELHNILDLAKRLRGPDRTGELPRYPRILADLEPGYFRRFGEQYVNDTRAYRDQAPFFIDKMPNNFLHVGLIGLILPNAKVIDARRHPMACCFGGFKQLFGEGQGFSYGLTEIGNYYRQYAKLMDHWDEVLPGFVLRVRHEDVVDDLEGQVRRLLDFCGLPFEPACLDYHRTERSIRTPSAEQVRRPIYRSSLDQWRRFEPWLGPLKEALGPEILSAYEVDG